MKTIVERLTALGYTPDKAENLYELYAQQGQLDELRGYIALKECLGATGEGGFYD